MHAIRLLAAVAVVCAVAGCANRRPAARVELTPPVPVRAPSSTDAVPVTLADKRYRVEYTDCDGPEDMTYTYSEYRMDGTLRHRVWRNVGIAGRAWYDRSGRLRALEAEVCLPVYVDLSGVRPEEIQDRLFPDEFLSSRLKGVYLVGNRYLRDEDLLKLYEDPRIHYMIVERCRRVSRDALRTIKPKLVHKFPS
jgi:hypothetical protein